MDQPAAPPLEKNPRQGFCPYVGLDAYTESESDYFFGRDGDQRILAANLYASRLTILYGASGVGKTSVLLAGLVPRLRADPGTAVVIFREWQTAAFGEALKSECVGAVERLRGEPLTIDVRLPMDELLFELGQMLPGPIVLLMDQFEEYFLYHPDFTLEGTTGFDVELARLVNREDVDVSILIVLREEGLASLDRFRIRIRNLLGNRVRLRHLDLTAAEAAIRRPLDVYNTRVGPARQVHIEEPLVEAVLSDVRTGRDLLGGNAGKLPVEQGSDAARIETPFLQMVMTRLWVEEEAANSRGLRLATYQRLGGAERIVQVHLESALTALSHRDQAAAAQAFRYMVTPSRTKISYTVTDLAQFTALDRERLAPVLQRLAQGRARILREVQPATPAADKPAEVRYEIFHDVLASAILDWQRQFMTSQARSRQMRRFVSGLLLAFGVLVVGYFLVYVPWLERQPWGNMQNASTGEVYNLSGSMIRIGRSVLGISNEPGISNEIDLKPRSISRIHMIVFRDSSAVDVRSVNGTTVNAEFLPYGRAKTLRDGDIIALAGEAVLTFSGRPPHPESRVGGSALVIDGKRRKIISLSQGANYLKLDDTGRVSITQDDPSDALVVIRVYPNANLGERISITSNVDGLRMEVKIDDYRYESFFIQARRECALVLAGVYHYRDTNFQIVDVVGHQSEHVLPVCASSRAP